MQIKAELARLPSWGVGVGAVACALNAATKCVWHVACGASSGATATATGAWCHFELAPMSSNCLLSLSARMSTGCHIRQIYPQGTVQYSASFHLPLLPPSSSHSLFFALLTFRFSARHGSLDRLRSISISRTIRCGQPDGNYVNHVTSPASTAAAQGDPHKCTKGGKGCVSESRKVIGQPTLVSLNLCNLRLSLSLSLWLWLWLLFICHLVNPTFVLMTFFYTHWVASPSHFSISMLNNSASKC